MIDEQVEVVPLLESLKNKGGVSDCPRCRVPDAGWTFVDLVNVGRITALTLVCNNCGFVASHALDRLRPKEERELLK